MRRRTTEEFINECVKKHNNKYDYSKTIYTKKDNKVTIICPIHGEFEQIANTHIRGGGCKKCSQIGPKKRTTEEFINECVKKHNNKYDYSKTIYINLDNKVTIICPIHGEFEQIARNHLKGCNCYKCGLINQGDKRRKSTEEFINECINIHGDKYDYSKVNYINANTKVIIICPEHGEFKQTPKAHLTLKQGCPICYNQIRKYSAPSWNVDSWTELGKNSKHYSGFKLYKIRCYNDNEEFIKIGRTFNDIKIRYQSDMPYKYEILKIIESDNGEYIFNLENRIKRIFKNYKYTPNIKFGGMYECFTLT